MRFEVYQQRTQTLLGAGQWRWRLKGDNGEIIAQGESYTTLQNCLHAVSLVKQAGMFTQVINSDTGLPLLA